MFTNDKDVINNISDDMNYLRDLIKREKKDGLDCLKEAHLTRIVIVFAYNTMEAYKDLIIRTCKFDSNTKQWDKFLRESPLTPYFLQVVNSDAVKLENLEKVLTLINGLKALRDFITHGLVDETAIKFKEKMNSLDNSQFNINPTKLKISDAERVFKFDLAMINLIGLASTLYKRKKH